MPTKKIESETVTATSGGEIAESLFHLINLQSLDALSDHVDNVAEAIKTSNNVAALKAVAEYGSPSQKRRAVKELLLYTGSDFK